MKMLFNLNYKSFARNTPKNNDNDQKIRKKYLYNILDDKQIQILLKEDNLNEAKRLCQIDPG